MPAPDDEDAAAWVRCSASDAAPGQGAPPIQAQGVWNQQLPLWKRRVQPQLPFGKFGSLEHLKDQVKNAKEAEIYHAERLRQRKPKEPEVTAADVPSAGRAESETQLPEEQQKPQLEPMQQQQQEEQLAQSTSVTTADDEDWESKSGVAPICSICNEAETFGSEGVCCDCDWKRDPRYKPPAAQEEQPMQLEHEQEPMPQTQQRSPYSVLGGW